MAGDARVEMRWPAEVHSKAKVLAAERGQTVTGLCLGLLMVELERAAALRAAEAKS